MDLTVVICTYNRSRLLKKCLGALEKLDIPQGITWEILIVDNDSTDDTRSTAENFRKGTRVHIRYSFEPRLGIARARNRGVMDADGSLIAFLDDDCIPEKSSLSNLYRTFKDYPADCVGGKILPMEWPQAIPAWFGRDLYSYVGVYDNGDAVKECKTYFETPFSANIAYKRRIFDKVGLFNPCLGRVGKNSTYGGEETVLNKAILESGGRIFYQPNSVVYHPLPMHKLRKSFFRAMDFHSGEKKALILFGPYKQRNIFGIPFFIFRQFFKSIFTYIKCVIRDGHNRSFRKELYCWNFLGFMWGRIRYWYGYKRNNQCV